MILSRAMPGKPSQHRAVSFVHLGCAALFGVKSELAWALPPSIPPEQDVERGWQILVLKPESRDDFKKRGSLARRLVSTPGGRDADRRGKVATMVRDRLRHSLRGGDLRPGDSDEALRLYCPKCCIWISVPSRRLTDHAERHPGHEANGELVAYVADRGEIVYRRDAYAEELVRRDGRARGRQPTTAPVGSLKRYDTWTPVRTAPKGR